MDLKKCPHCGSGELEKHELGTPWVLTLRSIPGEYDLISNICVRCTNCGDLGPPCSTWEQAQIEWNNRTFWTPISDGAPNKDGDYLVKADYGEYAYVLALTYYMGAWCFFRSTYVAFDANNPTLCNKIIAWSEIPE